MDFTSALYLGMCHPAGALRPWPSLTLGTPAALRELPGAASVAGRIAALQGLPAGLLGVSTLHLLWDLVGLLACEGRPVLVDAGAYAVSRWALERVRARAGIVIEIGHHDVERASRVARRLPGPGPVILVDGYCPECGKVAPVGALDDIARDNDGWLVCDDTQALGILGARPSASQPYGLGGAGVLAHTGAAPSRTLLVASLAKGFGVPVAALSGPVEAIRWFDERSQTRMHCSPPSAAVIAASDHALRLNDEHGDALRGTLVARVRQFRQGLASAGIATAPASLFPVQSIGAIADQDGPALERRLAAVGVRAVRRRGRCRPGVHFTFLITATHTPLQIAAAAWRVAAACQGPRTAALPRRMTDGT